MRKSLKLVVAAAGLLTMSATASAFSTAPCKACHAIDHDVVGPAWKTVAKEYGDEATLAKVFKSGFKVGDRKVVGAIPKWKGQASTMTGMYGMYIKGHEDDAAKALFDAVKAGKM